MRRIGPGAQLLVKILQLLLGEIFDGGETVLGALHRNDQLGKLKLESHRVAILCVLNEKHHEKRNDGRAGVDDELPSVAVVKQGPSDRPNQYRQCGNEECHRCAGRVCGRMRKVRKIFAEQAALRAMPAVGTLGSLRATIHFLSFFHCPACLLTLIVLQGYCRLQPARRRNPRPELISNPAPNDQFLSNDKALNGGRGTLVPPRH